MAIDSAGNKLIEKQFRRKGTDYVFNYNLVNINNYFYSIGYGGTAVTNLPYQPNKSMAVYKYTETGDTVFTKIYYGDTTYISGGKALFKYKRNKLLLFGLTDSTCGHKHCGKYQFTATVLDSNGNKLYNKNYLSKLTYKNYVFVHETSDKGYLIPFFEELVNGIQQGRLLKLDSNLNIVWNRLIPNSFSIGGVLEYNKNIFLVDNKLDSISIINYFKSEYTSLHLIKYSSTGVLLWDRAYAGGFENISINQLFLDQLGTIERCKNGDFLLGGYTAADTLIGGQVLRIDSNGHVKWWRNYRYDKYGMHPVDPLSQSYLGKVKELANGDIGLSGYCYQIANTWPYRQAWLMRLDSNGCLDTACPPNRANQVNTIKEIKVVTQSKVYEASLYPNPAYEVLNISLLNENIEIKELSVFDVTGKRYVLVSNPNFINKQYALAIENLPSGVYYLKMKAKDGSINKKFEVIH